MLTKEEFINQNKNKIYEHFAKNYQVFANPEECALKLYNDYVALENKRNAQKGDVMKLAFGKEIKGISSVSPMSCVTRDFVTLSVEFICDDGSIVKGNVKLDRKGLD